MPLRHFVKALPLIFALLGAACAFPTRTPEQTHIGSIPPQIGAASWYGASLHGRPTANGEVFDRDVLSAAHQTWPIPSLVQVVNLENGREVVVRLNDRGPFSGNRIIDVSQAAAQALGFEHLGHARVRITYLGPAPTHR